ncbi:hypothetical protein BB559_001367 [Furculomyces boomerangus]|uniref:Peptidase S8/S53 domain-containing protein n=2 Tax=Harpellales TaxID=61421 RepID=A0A2T9Z248_9FUNG|nr:hypothetical protein BB559_001367 [Furculomyces boomerangus]PWA02146.1 hypothetical protein BB558_001733 [Smittium angustum]
MFFRSLTLFSLIASFSVASPFLFNQVTKQAPLLSETSVETIPDNYIVVFKKHVQPGLESFRNHFNTLNSFISASGASQEKNKINHIYEHGIVGYAGQFEPELIEGIRNSDDVEYVERDQIVYASDTQSGATWGLARISHREPMSLANYNKYLYDPKAGTGVTVYIVDTGINIQHVDFEGRAVWGKTIPSGDTNTDGNGHGTHVAGTVGSKTYGVAKKAKLVAVKVLRSNGSGTMSDVVSGVSYTVSDHVQRTNDAIRTGSPAPISVANMSLGGGNSQALTSAVTSAVASGITYVVAAGNDNRDACSYSPANTPNAITVGSTDFNDARSYFSNYGKCVDVFAPGRNILSTWIGSNTATNTISGTSMASPHVAGLAAYYLSLSNTKLTPAQVMAKIVQTCTSGIVTSPGTGSPNLLVYNSAPASLV